MTQITQVSKPDFSYDGRRPVAAKSYPFRNQGVVPACGTGRRFLISEALDRRLRLPACDNHKETAEDRAIALHNFIDFECVCFRENAGFKGISDCGALR